jgi:hypothetical protein
MIKIITILLENKLSSLKIMSDSEVFMGTLEKVNFNIILRNLKKR